MVDTDDMGVALATSLEKTWRPMSRYVSICQHFMTCRNAFVSQPLWLYQLDSTGLGGLTGLIFVDLLNGA